MDKIAEIFKEVEAGYPLSNDDAVHLLSELEKVTQELLEMANQRNAAVAGYEIKRARFEVACQERDKAIDTIRKAFAELGQGESFEAYKTLKELGVKKDADT